MTFFTTAHTRTNVAPTLSTQKQKHRPLLRPHYDPPTSTTTTLGFSDSHDLYAKLLRFVRPLSEVGPLGFRPSPAKQRSELACYSGIGPVMPRVSGLWKKSSGSTEVVPDLSVCRPDLWIGGPVRVRPMVWRVRSAGLRVRSLVLRVRAPSLRVRSTGLRVRPTGLRVRFLALRVRAPSLRVRSTGLRVRRLRLATRGTKDAVRLRTISGKR